MLRWGWIALIAAVLAVYAGHVREAGFVYEDTRLVDGAQMGGPLDRSWLARPRGISFLSWQIVQTPIAAHALNLSLHLLGIASIAALAWALSRSAWLAFAAAAIFGLHPLSIQAVAYAAGRAELIASLGVLLACAAAARGGWAWIAVPAAAWLALGGKETAVILLGLLPLTLLAQGRWRLWMAPIAALAGLGAILAIRAVLEQPSIWLLLQIGEHPGQATTAGAWLLLQASAAVRLIVLTLAPLPQWLTVDPALSWLPAIAGLAALVLLAGLAEIAVRAWGARRLQAYGLAWMLLAIAPRLIVQTPLSVFNEHQWRLALAGASIALAASLLPQKEQIAW